MFFIFDFLRQRARDAVLTGVYDAIELMESENAEQPIPEIESGTANASLPQAAETPVALPQPQPTPPVVPSQPQPSSSAVPPQPSPTPPKTNPPIPPRPVPMSRPDISQADLLSGLPGQQTLPGMRPRKRGRPSKQPPGGNRQ
jgi:outer membrane biosynthesis protein TonB